MSHYNIDYSLLEGDAKRAKALEDIKEFWGEERFNRIVEALKANEAVTLTRLGLILSFGGVEGYPVKALHEHVWPDREDLRKSWN